MPPLMRDSAFPYRMITAHMIQGLKHSLMAQRRLKALQGLRTPLCACQETDMSSVVSSPTLLPATWQFLHAGRCAPPNKYGRTFLLCSSSNVGR